MYLEPRDPAGGAGAGAHAMLSGTHVDATPGAVVRGDLMVGSATPKWSRFSLGVVGTFLAAGATDPIWRGLEVGDVPDLSGLYSPVAHDHSGVYSPVGHEHEELYSPIGHGHNGAYSPIGHNHDSAYSPVGHTHDDRYYTETETDTLFAGAGHDHDGSYSPLGHDHAGVYSPVAHGHDETYSPLVHAHEELYSPLAHGHDETYSPLVHAHEELYSPLAHDHDDSYSPVGHTHDTRYYTESELDAGQLDGRYYTETETGLLLAGKADATHTHRLLYDDPENERVEATPDGARIFGPIAVRPPPYSGLFAGATDDKCVVYEPTAMDVGTEDFALSFWVRASALYGMSVPISCISKREYPPEDPSEPVGWYGLVFEADGTFSLKVYTDSWSPGAFGPVSILDDEWHFCVQICDRDGYAKTFVDMVSGTPVDFSAWSGSLDTEYAGRFLIGGGTHFDGQFLDVRVWKFGVGGLPAGVEAAFAEMYAHGPHHIPEGYEQYLVGHYLPGTPDWKDHSGYGNDLAPIGSPTWAECNVACAPLALAENAQGFLVKGLNAEFLDGRAVEEFAVLTEDGTVTGKWTFEDETYFESFVGVGTTVADGAQFRVSPPDGNCSVVFTSSNGYSHLALQAPLAQMATLQWGVGADGPKPWALYRPAGSRDLCLWARDVVEETGADIITFDCTTGFIYFGQGKAAAQARVDVKGNVLVRGEDGWDGAGDLALLEFGNATNPVGIGARYGGSGFGGVFIGVYKQSGGGYFGTNSLDAVMVEEVTGNVGIGTYTPRSLLDVAGALTLTSPGVDPGETSELRFAELTANGEDYVGFKAPDSVGGPMIWVLPAVDSTGTQYLRSDGAGNLSWGTPAGGGGTAWESSGGYFIADTEVIAAGDAFKMISRETDGASQVAHIFETENAFATTGAKLVSVRNQTTEKMFVTKDGHLYAGGELHPGSNAGNYLSGEMELYYGGAKVFEAYSLTALGRSVMYGSALQVRGQWVWYLDGDLETGDLLAWIPNEYDGVAGSMNLTLVDAYAVLKTPGTTPTTIDIYYCTQANIDGTPSWASVFGAEKLTIDANERSSKTAEIQATKWADALGTPAVLAQGLHLKAQVTTAGTEAAGLSVVLVWKLALKVE